jgi:Mn-containing catalase
MGLSSLGEVSAESHWLLGVKILVKMVSSPTYRYLITSIGIVELSFFEMMANIILNCTLTM